MVAKGNTYTVCVVEEENIWEMAMGYESGVVLSYVKLTRRNKL